MNHNTKFHYSNKNSGNTFTQKLLPSTPTHRSYEGQVPVKRISNFSYCLSDQVGLGLTSKVFRGKNDSNGSLVAVKCIDIKNNSDHLNQQFIKEQIAILQLIKTANSPHLLRLQSVIHTQNNLYIITQFCEGKDVAKLLRYKKVLTEQQAQTIMRQLILGYQQLFKLKIVHRDLKLSNLLISNGKVKLADFGFAINQEKCNNYFTYNVGSPKYMAPQTLRHNKYSYESDIWAMGVMAYEMIYGHQPWKERSDEKLYESICNVPIQLLFDPNIPLSEQYKMFICKCLKPNINQRARTDFLFSFNWFLASQLLENYQEQKKQQQIIKIKQNRYAVYSSSNQIKYESKQLTIDDFVDNKSIPTQFILLALLNYCRFLVNIIKSLKTLNSNNQLINNLIQEIGLTIQIIMKTLGDTTCMEINRIDAPGFEAYKKTGDWQNLKQLIIRFDMSFRAQLNQMSPLRKNSVIPQNNTLRQTIQNLKQYLPQNSRIVDKLLTYYQIKQVFITSKPIQFAEKVAMAKIIRQVEIPDNMINKQMLLNNVYVRLNILGI